MNRGSLLHEMARVQTWLALLMTGALAAVLTLDSVVGLTQRVFVVVVATWLIFLAARLRQNNTVIASSTTPART
jgi:hypothetical protein